MPYITVQAHVDLDEFDDDDIREEFESRCLGSKPDTSERMEQLTAIYQAMRLGHKDKAYALMQEYVLDAMGKVI